MVTGFGTPVHHQQSKSLFRFPLCPRLTSYAPPLRAVSSRGPLPLHAGLGRVPLAIEDPWYRLAVVLLGLFIPVGLRGLNMRSHDDA